MKCNPLRAAVALAVALTTAASPLLASAQTAYEYKAFKQGLIVNGSGAVQVEAPTPSGSALANLSATSIVWAPLVTPVTVGGSGTQSVLLLNPGTVDLQLRSAPYVTGSSEFTAQTECAATLAAGSSCVTSVTYAPQGEASAAGELSFDTSLGAKTVTLSGAPAYAKAGISASAGFSFGSVLPGGSNSLSFTVTNTGTTTLRQVYMKVDDASVSATSSTCGTEAAPLQTLAKGGTCSITLKWTPPTEGAFSTPIKVFASGALLTQQELTGTGAPPATVKLQAAGFRTWSDGTLASSCKSYLNPPDSAHVYQGNTGSGIYKILPAGQAEILVYCDMTTAGGGWTLIGKYAQWGGSMLEVRSVLLRGAYMQGWSDTPGTHPAYKGNNVFQEIRYATGNATWNSKYGVTAANGIKFATWAAWPTITSANQWVVNAKKLDGTSTPALATIASHAAAWWTSKPVEQTRQGKGIELSLFTVPNNGGDCGGESVAATNKICGITGYWDGGSLHYDVISEKWLFGR